MAYKEKTPSAAEHKKAVEKLEQAIKISPMNLENGHTHRLWLVYSLYSLMLEEKKGKDPAAAKGYYKRAIEVADEAAKMPPNVSGNDVALKNLRDLIEKDKPQN
jgi:hypothetical protein